MAENLQDTISRIRAKVSVILDRQDKLVQQITAERAAAAAMQKEMERLNEELRRLKADHEYLTVMRAVAVTPQQAEQSRAMLNGLVREIDRCITELKAC